MKFIYQTIINALLFYFFINLFNGIQVAGASNDLLANILAGLMFGAMIAFIPTLLKFFKLPVNGGSTFLMALIVVFIFLFLLYVNFLGLGNISSSTLNLGFLGERVRLGPVQTMVAATVVISLSVLGLKSLESSK